MQPNMVSRKRKRTFIFAVHKESALYQKISKIYIEHSLFNKAFPALIGKENLMTLKGMF